MYIRWSGKDDLGWEVFLQVGKNEKALMRFWASMLRLEKLSRFYYFFSLGFCLFDSSDQVIAALVLGVKMRKTKNWVRLIISINTPNTGSDIGAVVTAGILL